MMKSINREKHYNGSFLWRGIVGGLLGGIIGIAVLHSFQANSVRAAFSYWALLGMIRALPFTITGGLVVGMIILSITRSLGTGRLSGAIVGASVAAIAGGIIGVILNQLIIDETHRYVWESFLVRYGAIVGAVAGIISGAQNHKRKNDLDR